MTSDLERRTGGLAVALGVVAFASVASLALFFAIGGPFGAINDWSIGLIGILTGLLALALNRGGAGSAAPIGAVSTGIAAVGAVIVVAGSALVISRTTGFFLAGLVESLGFAFVGAWLLVVSRGVSSTKGWPRRLATLGIAAGAIMAIGVIVLPGIAMRLDDEAAAPA